MENNKLQFYMGRATSAIPIIFFIVWAVSICIAGTPDVNGLILGGLIGITFTMFFVKGSWGDYCDAIFTGMANRIGVIAIVCWFWAGIFAQVLRAGGLVHGLIWLGYQTHVGGGLFVGITFILAALFATAVGTGYGTVVAFCTLMYPVGVGLGSDPTLLFAAILAGAAFGDNLAPVSDTTIVSAVTQETDIPGVVRSRFKYAITAAIPALILFIIFGSNNHNTVEILQTAEMAAVSSKGLILLIPFALVIILALSGKHIVVALTFGILSAIGLIAILNLAPMTEILEFNLKTKTVEGALIEGFMGYMEMAILILMIMAAGYIMKAGGAMDIIKEYAFMFIKESARRAEVVIWAFVAALNAVILINTAAEITAAPFVLEIGKKLKIHPYRRANFLDAISSALGYIFPWSGGVLIGYATIVEMNKLAPSLPVITPTEVWPYVFHGWILVIVMLIAAITGLGRRYETKSAL